MAPLATGAHEIEQAVEQAAHVCGPRPPAGLSWRNERFDQAILVIAQSLARSKVADPSAIRGRPHCGLQTGKGSGGTLSTALVARQTNQHTLSKRALRRYRFYCLLVGAQVDRGSANDCFEPACAHSWPQSPRSFDSHYRDNRFSCRHGNSEHYQRQDMSQSVQGWAYIC